MKQSDTPLGEAYVKASDALERRYVTYQYPRGINTVNFIGDKTTGRVKIEVRNTDSNKLITTFKTKAFSADEMSDKKIPSSWKNTMDRLVPKDYDISLAPDKVKSSPFVEPNRFVPNKKYPPGQKPQIATAEERLLKERGLIYDTPTGSKQKAQAKPMNPKRPWDKKERKNNA